MLVRLLDSAIGIFGVMIGMFGAMLTNVAQVAPSAPAENWTQLIGQYGLMGGLVLMLVYWGREREKALSERLNSAEDFIRDKLIGTIDANTQVMRELTE